jgi:thymidylate synthase (FAD)
MPSRLIWITPNAEDLIVYMARVSNPASQERGDSPGKLIRYLMDHKHWSPFEMVSACVEIETTRDIGRQILRHKSLNFQEFSQRYQVVSELPAAPLRQARSQDPKNRQSSTPIEDQTVIDAWDQLQQEAVLYGQVAYQDALKLGIAKEQARALLPEGLTMSRMYVAGTIRSWFHYCSVRCGLETQYEHRVIAQEIAGILAEEMPVTFQRLIG